MKPPPPAPRKIYSIHRDAMGLMVQIFVLGIAIGMLLTIVAVSAPDGWAA